MLGGCCVVVLMEGGIARRCVDWRRNLGRVGVAGGYWSWGLVGERCIVVGVGIRSVGEADGFGGNIVGGWLLMMGRGVWKRGVDCRGGEVGWVVCSGVVGAMVSEWVACRLVVGWMCIWGLGGL